MKRTDYVLPMQYTEEVEALRFVKANGHAVAEWCGGDVVTTVDDEVVCLWVKTPLGDKRVVSGQWLVRSKVHGTHEVVSAEDFRARFTVVA